MRWTDGRGYTAPTQGNVNRSVQKNLEEIDRRLMRQQKPAEPTNGGAMQGFTRARPGTSSWAPSSVQLNGWTFDSALDLSPAPKPTLTTDGSDYFGVVDAGWYVTHVRAQATIGGASPVAALVQINDRPGTYSTEPTSYYAEEWALQSPFDSRYRVDFWAGPFWLGAGDVVLGVKMSFPGTVTPGSVTSAYVDVWRVG